MGVIWQDLGALTTVQARQFLQKKIEPRLNVSYVQKTRYQRLLINQ